MTIVPKCVKMVIHFSGHGQNKILPVTVVGSGHDSGATRLQEIEEGAGIGTWVIKMFHDFEADNYREFSVFRGKIFVGGAGLQSKFGMNSVCIGYAIRGDIDASDGPTIFANRCANAAVAAAKVEEPFFATVQPRYLRLQRWQQISVAVVQLTVVINIPGNVDALAHVSSTLIVLAGFPATTWAGAISFMATARAPTMAPSPTVTPGPMKASAATQASAPIKIGDFISGRSARVIS